MNQEKSQEKKIKIKINDEQAKGSYANFMKVFRTKEEFVLDFVNVVPPTGTVTSRVIVSPGHLKRIVAVLQKNLKSYEEKHGKIEEAQSFRNKKEIGFKPK